MPKLALWRLKRDGDGLTLTQAGIHHRLLIYAALSPNLGVPSARMPLYAALGPGGYRYKAQVQGVLEQAWELGEDGYYRNLALVSSALLSEKGRLFNRLGDERRRQAEHLAAHWLRRGFRDLDDIELEESHEADAGPDRADRPDRAELHGAPPAA